VSVCNVFNIRCLRFWHSIGNKMPNRKYLLTMRHLLILICFFCLSFDIFSQDSVYWSLNECVAHAMTNSIDLKISKNQEVKAKYQSQLSQWDLAPSVNAYGAGNLNFQRSTNQNNEIASGESYNVGYGLNSSIVLFNGFAKLNSIKASRYNELVYSQSTRYNANKMYLQIIELFTSALYTQSLIGVANEKLQISLNELQRVETLIQVGKMEPVAIYEIKATITGNNIEIERLRISYRLKMLQLSQLIELPNSESFNINGAEFDLLIPQPNDYNLLSAYETACLHLPQIKQKEHEIAYIRSLLLIARGKMSPSLSLSGGYSSHFYSTDLLNDGKQTPFENQFKNYLNPLLCLSLNVPLFNGFYQKYKVKQNRIDLENSMYYLEKEKRQIQREIEESILQLEAYQTEFVHANEHLEAMLKSFEITQEKYHLGLVNTTDFNTAQNLLVRAKTNVIQAKFNWVVQDKMIRLYLGEELF
jgi:outer membrane protein